MLCHGVFFSFYQFEFCGSGTLDGRLYLPAPVTVEGLFGVLYESLLSEKHQETVAGLSSVLAHDADRLDTHETFDQRLAANRKRFLTLAEQARAVSR
jgi:phosphoenolpyruvate carboxylase